MTFDDMYGKKLPKISNQPGFENRSLSVYSAGKIFSATGVRCGWVIGCAQLIQYVRSVHQYNVFCGNGIV
jgi:aspartate/methionine/tyrosine aminotransferase